jgi:hypothetical protein
MRLVEAVGAGFDDVRRGAKPRVAVELLAQLAGPEAARRISRQIAAPPPMRLTILWLEIRRVAPHLVGNMRVHAGMAPSFPAYEYTRRNLARSLRRVPLTKDEVRLLRDMRTELLQRTGLRGLMHDSFHLTFSRAAWPLFELEAVDPARSRALTGRRPTRRVTLTSPKSIEWLRSQGDCALPVVLLHEEFHIAVAARIGRTLDEPPLAVRLEELVADLVEYILRLWLYDSQWPTHSALGDWLDNESGFDAMLWLAQRSANGRAGQIQLRVLADLTADALSSGTDRGVARLLTRLSGERRSLPEWRQLLGQAAVGRANIRAEVSREGGKRRLLLGMCGRAADPVDPGHWLNRLLRRRRGNGWGAPPGRAHDIGRDHVPALA